MDEGVFSGVVMINYRALWKTIGVMVVAILFVTIIALSAIYIPAKYFFTVMAIIVLGYWGWLVYDRRDRRNNENISSR